MTLHSPVSTEIKNIHRTRTGINVQMSVITVCGPVAKRVSCCCYFPKLNKCPGSQAQRPSHPTELFDQKRQD